jgi:hypothetical protein
MGKRLVRTVESPLLRVVCFSPPELERNQTIPTGSTSMVQPRGKVSWDNIRDESGPRRKSCHRYLPLALKAKAGTGPMILSAVSSRLSAIRRYTLSASR